MDYLELIKLQLDHKVSVIANAVAWFAAALNITQFTDQIKITLISQLIKGIQEFSKNYLNILISR